MESSIEEALTLKSYAEKIFAERDFSGARNYALRAQMLCPELDGIAQMAATFGVYAASEAKINGEFDFYAILGLDPSVEKSKVKKQYRKMAVLLHPDKNKTAGADEAFKLVSEAWTVLSDSFNRNAYDHRRTHVAGHTTGTSGLDSSHTRLDTFWTICSSCHVQYEYMRKYVNKRLSCKTCRGVFIAVETGVPPVSGSYDYSSTSYVTENGYGSHGSSVTYIPASSAYSAGNGMSGHHSGHGTDYAANVSFQWNSFPDNSTGVLDSNGFSSVANASHKVNSNARNARVSGGQHSNVATVAPSNGFTVSTEASASKAARPYKRRRVYCRSTSGIDTSESAKSATALKMMNGDGDLKANPNASMLSDNSARRCSTAPAFDARQLLIDKARKVIREKLEKFTLAAEAAREKKAKTAADEVSDLLKRAACTGERHGSESKKGSPAAISVPDPDFHDFDKDRSEECFKPKQIWALYDEEDGMPRLYCLIREVVSVEPFKISISYLSSKTDTEFGSVNWLSAGFTKSCGSFRVYNSDVVEQVNIFSHLLSREKAGRGGCLKIYPRRGDIWAVYRNWSSDWNRKTPAEVRHRYEMVEVLDDYSEELGVCVSPLSKLDGFKTVYQRNESKDAKRRIPRREMLRFSHQVPSCLLKGYPKLPDGCWDLDPAATPDELLQSATELPKDERRTQEEIMDATICGPHSVKTCEQAEKSSGKMVNEGAIQNGYAKMLDEARLVEQSSLARTVPIILAEDPLVENNVQA